MSEERLKEIKDSIDFQKKIVESVGVYDEIFQEEMELYNEVVRLKQENKELTRLVANKVVADYDYDSILKKQLNEERLKYISLEESKNEIENTINDFEKWLDEELNITYRDCGHKHNILQEVMNKLQELKGINNDSNK